MNFYIKCQEDSDHWVRRGAALLTQLDYWVVISLNLINF